MVQSMMYKHLSKHPFVIMTKDNMLTEWEEPHKHNDFTFVRHNYLFCQLCEYLRPSLQTWTTHNKMFVQTSFHNQRGAENHEGKQNRVNHHST